MQYTQEITINLPLEKVVALFNNEDNLPKWMPGLKEIQHVEGIPGQKGARSRMRFKMGSREIDMIETIIENRLPDEITTTYDTKGVHNKIISRFSIISENQTRYTSYQEFKFSGMMRVWSLLMPGVFKKESFKYLQNFKEFAEVQGQSPAA